MALVSSCAELQSFGVKDTDGMGDKQQKPVPRAAAAYGRQLKICSFEVHCVNVAQKLRDW